MKYVEDINDWKANLRQKKKDGKIDVDVEAICADNDVLLCYLNMLIQFVNKNPGLLNETVTRDPKVAKKNYATRLGLKERYIPEALRDKRNE